jgi:hypothetical protein
MESTPSMPELQPVESRPPATSLAGRLLNVFAAPGDVFDEIKTAPPCVSNWLVPVLLAAVVGVISVCIIFAQPGVRQTIHEQHVKALDKQVQQGTMTQAQEDQALQVMEKFTGPTMLAILGSFGVVVSSFISIFWWALLLWLFGRWFLRARFDYLKAVEVAGLGSVIITLGLIITALLAASFGRLYATPSLALLVSEFDPSQRVHALLGAVNVIYLWHAGVLSVGLAKLSGAPVAKAAVIVFGYWVLVELLLIAIGLGQWAL